LPLAALRWRRPEARLLLVMACIPQTMLFYDQLPLLVVARNFRQSLYFCLVSYAAAVVAVLIYGGGPKDRALLFAQNAPVIVGCYYLPCLILVLLRPNTGDVPHWLERLTKHLPTWLRGHSVLAT